MKTSLKQAALAAAVILLLVAGLWLPHEIDFGKSDDLGGSIALIVSDQVSTSDPMVTVWADAAREEGVRVEVISMSDFLRPSVKRRRHDYAGVILPDMVARSASPPFLQRIEEYVQAGGKLMLVYDAATHTVAGAYYPQRAPLSNLVGVDYAMYDSLQNKTTELRYVCAEPAALAELKLPPGRAIAPPQASAASLSDKARCIAGYQYGILSYNRYATQGKFAGQTLLSTMDGELVAGRRAQGQGETLFVNLPLGYLKGQTDGILLHGFLRYFAVRMLALPTLSAAPNGMGGLIFNWHVDSNAAIGPIADLDQSGILRQGPFSIHFTAGPDARQFGDGLGLNLAHNATMQQWVKRFKARGDALGNHGGWIHDYFGLNVNENNQAEMEKYLVLNNQVVEAANGAPVREYSAPVGNQPKWVTAWLEAHGYVAYYFTGNGGMAPTRSYRDGKLLTAKIWSFPVLSLGKVASFEESAENDIAEKDMTDWLLQVTDFTANTGTIRMVYSHPPGFRRYPRAINAWFAHTQTLLDTKRFSWYTMTQVADFLNRRELTEWHIRQEKNGLSVQAEHPINLAQLTWQFPKAAFDKPVIEKGDAVVSGNEQFWLITVNNSRILLASSKFHQGSSR